MQVIDGDTIEVELLKVPESLADELKAGMIVKVRYIGANAPERDSDSGLLATRLNRLLVMGKRVFLEMDKRLFDDYHRLLAYVYLDPDGHLMVNAILIMTQVIPAYPPGLFKGTNRYDECFQEADRWCLPCQCVEWVEVARKPGDYLGEVLWVCGPVKSTKRSRKGHIFINLGNPYPRTPRFSIVIWDDYVPAFDLKFGLYWERMLEGKTVCVKGKVETYNEIPEIKAADPNQLSWEDSVPACCRSYIH
ncbi:TPA: hypothetical protein EYP13_02670 [Candidatus Micrarchaeota archaeon]|nr:hypothetical protein [Candidatus Micrarchaeota archaeon]